MFTIFRLTLMIEPDCHNGHLIQSSSTRTGCYQRILRVERSREFQIAPPSPPCPQIVTCLPRIRPISTIDPAPSSSVTFSPPAFRLKWSMPGSLLSPDHGNLAETKGFTGASKFSQASLAPTNWNKNRLRILGRTTKAVVQASSPRQGEIHEGVVEEHHFFIMVSVIHSMYRKLESSTSDDGPPSSIISQIITIQR